MSGEGDKRADEDAAWREIIEHYGERPEVPELSDISAPPTFGDEVDQPIVPDRDSLDPLDDDYDPFIPPDPGPLPKLPPERLLAWIGLLGAPVAAIVLVVLSFVTDWAAPHWVDGFIVLAFLGGFAFLVATMPKERDDPWDDGARL